VPARILVEVAGAAVKGVVGVAVAVVEGGETEGGVENGVGGSSGRSPRATTPNGTRMPGAAGAAGCGVATRTEIGGAMMTRRAARAARGAGAGANATGGAAGANGEVRVARVKWKSVCAASKRWCGVARPLWRWAGLPQVSAPVSLATRELHVSRLGLQVSGFRGL